MRTKAESHETTIRYIILPQYMRQLHVKYQGIRGHK